ncbi:hypothetical protein ACFL2J_00960 [Candidatus Omnitrophota bacterium]
MNFYVIGIDYRAIQPEIRQVICRRRNEIEEHCQNINLGQIAVLFTCNRIEIYGTASDDSSVWKIVYSLRKRFPELFSKIYVKNSSHKTIRHALRLACGLESPILGEQQIVDQLRLWVGSGLLPLLLRALWVQVLAVAEDIRFKSGINIGKSDVVEFVLSDLKKRINLQKQREVVVIGTGKIAQLVSEKQIGKTKLYFASRKRHSRSRRLARNSDGQAILLDDLGEKLLTADALISATSSPHLVLKRSHLVKAASQRKRILYLYDLAVPRDIDPGVANIKNVFLQDLDSLENVFKQHNQSFEPYALSAGFLIEETVRAIEEKIDAYAYQGRDAAELVSVEAV